MAVDYLNGDVRLRIQVRSLRPSSQTLPVDTVCGSASISVHHIRSVGIGVLGIQQASFPRNSLITCGGLPATNKVVFCFDLGAQMSRWLILRASYPHSL